MSEGKYVKLRKSVREHVTSGRMSPLEFAAFCVVLIEADYKTGVWVGSGVQLAALLKISNRHGRRLLESLTRKGYLHHSWKLNPGSGYLVEILKYLGSKFDDK